MLCSTLTIGCVRHIIYSGFSARFVGRKGKLLHEYNVKNDRTVVAEKEKDMAKEKKLVEAITSMEEDFAQWYTDVVKKAELIDYSAVKGCMIIKPDGYAIWEKIGRAHV